MRCGVNAKFPTEISVPAGQLQFEVALSCDEIGHAYFSNFSLIFDGRSADTGRRIAQSLLHAFPPIDDAGGASGPFGIQSRGAWPAGLANRLASGTQAP